MADLKTSWQFEDIRVLLLEDNPADAELLEYELRHAGFIFVLRHVTEKASYTKAIEEFSPDIILSDYELPSMNGWEALQIRKELCPETPFILVTGAVGEERAIEILTGGATDYVLKRNLSRLLPAINRALKEAYEHRKRKEAEAERDNLLKELEERVRERTEALEKEIAEHRRSEEKFSIAFARNAAAMSIVRMKDEKYLDVNNAWTEIFGYSREEVIGRTSLELNLWPGIQERERMYHMLRDNGSVRELEMKTRRRSGENCYINLSADLVNMAGERVILASCLDITARKQAEEGLRESEKHYRNLVLSSPDAIIVHLHGKILFANPAALKLFGAENEEALKRIDLRNLVPPEELEVATRRSLKALSGESQPPRDGKMLRLDGEVVHVEITSSSVDYEGKDAVQVLYRNIAERRKEEEAFRKWSAKLETAYKDLDAFTYSVSHDLQAPLRAMDGFTKMILKEHGQSMAPEFRRKFDVITENSELMQKMIEALLSLSRIGRKGISRSEVDMDEVVDSVRQDLQAANPKRDIQWIKGRLPVASCDRTLIRQVVYNLLSNAVKFTAQRKRARIEFGSRTEQDEIIFFVKDNGVGFDMRSYDRLFVVFQRLHSQSEFKGRGIGLALVQRIVRLHGGRVWAEGQPGKGAIFYFSLPTA